MLTARQLLQKTPLPVRQRAAKCLPTRIGKVIDTSDKKRGISKHAVYRVRGTTDTYRVTLDMMPRANVKVVKVIPSAPVWVSCTCPFFMYNCEFALARTGNSSILYTNGQPAKTTNPRNVPYLCKHAYRALRHLLATRGK